MELNKIESILDLEDVSKEKTKRKKLFGIF